MLVTLVLKVSKQNLNQAGNVSSFLKDIQQSRNSTQSLETSISEFRFLCALGGDLLDIIEEESLTVLQDTIEKIHYAFSRSMHRLHLHNPSTEVLTEINISFHFEFFS